MIETPRRVTYDWFGGEGEEPSVGSFLRTERDRTFHVASARRVAVRVSRGETCRLSLELVRWRDEVPPDVRLYDLYWTRRR